MKQQTKYNTNLASEFYIMSTLFRHGLSPGLTLGNKKSVDIQLEGKTIDVKGVRAKAGWLLGNKLPISRNNHFIVLVRYHKIEDLSQVPECYIIPSNSIKRLAKSSKKGWYISYTKDHIKKISKFRDNWSVLD